MTIPLTQPAAHQRRLGRSVAAILSGLIATFVLSLGTDQVLHVLSVYPPWGQPMFDPGLNLLALSYRLVFNVAGCYIAGRLAPHAPMCHALILGAIGFVLSAVGTFAMLGMGPSWYPISLVVTALPCAWVGGNLARRAHTTNHRGEGR